MKTAPMSLQATRDEVALSPKVVRDTPQFFLRLKRFASGLPTLAILAGMCGLAVEFVVPALARSLSVRST